MNKAQKIGTIALCVFIAVLIVPSLFPKTMPSVAWCANMGVIGFSIAMVTLLSIIKNKDGSPYVSIPQLISKGVNWELIILISATMPLCNALESSEVGILTTVINWMTSVFSTLSPTMFLVAFVAVFLITTQFTHNLVLILVLTPILVKMGISFGIEPLLVAVLVYYTAMTAFLTPAASANAALIFGNNEWVRTKDAYFWGAAILVIAFIVIIGIGVPLGRILI